jgi:hypothetical protein
MRNGRFESAASKRASTNNEDSSHEFRGRYGNREAALGKR